MPPDTDRDRVILIGIAVVSVLVFAYSLLIAQAPFEGALIIVLVTLVYFGWRFVRALERIATALESRAIDDDG